MHPVQAQTTAEKHGDADGRRCIERVSRSSVSVRVKEEVGSVACEYHGRNSTFIEHCVQVVALSSAHRSTWTEGYYNHDNDAPFRRKTSAFNATRIMFLAANECSFRSNLNIDNILPE
mmetsp:Transcript_60006/g.177925  ORF Transcript_60006/g.177925 Transcript_60006/m.177925 type:complete len:118 (+) Transcript_60006:107-460(+)